MARLEGSDLDREKSTLLIVDDEKGPRESLRMILSPQHRVLTAVNGHEALRLLRENPIDAVTIDLNMPGMKGDQLMRTIRKEFPHTEVVIITGYSSVETAVDGLRHGIFDYLTKPFDVVEVSNTVCRALARRASRRGLIEFLRGIGAVLGAESDSEKALGELAKSPELQQRLRAALETPISESPDEREQLGEERRNEFLESLADTIEAREPHRSGHARRVAFLAGLIAERMALPAVQRERLRVACFLHDIGRVALPVSDSPDAEAVASSTLAQAEHSLVGSRLVEPLGFSPLVAEAIRHHHEHWDGSGQPEGLREDAIPLLSRIITVADTFDSLTHSHPQRNTLAPSEAIERLRECAGRELDAEILKELIVIAESGQSSSGPLLGLCFRHADDPIDTIASATAFLEGER
ncbi:MAG: response regulator [Deltaproteobacteria bacterium]|nr:response regulator [Deltaproteobacteria bacterium]